MLFGAESSNIMNYSSISVFFPAFNEEYAIKAATSSALSVIPGLFNDFEVIIVDDGSRDKTPQIADELAGSNKNVRVIHHAVNQGYGAALRSGLYGAKKELIFFTDGDGQFDIAEISNLLPLIDDADMAIGYRIKRRDPWHRLLFAWAWGTLIGILFGLWVRDTDCAFKLIKRRVVDSIQLKSDGAFISAELLIKAKKKGFKIKEAGIHHYPRKEGRQTGANIKVILRAFKELFKLWKELR
jgi:glycosyltransferase involved in cell wall biosynthesis